MSKPDFAAMRQAMVDSQLRPSGVNDPLVTQAMLHAPREDYVAKERAAICYMDRSIPLGDGRYLHPPVTTGMMLQESETAPQDNVLLIGGGTGYVAALIAPRVRSLTVIEESADLAKKTKKALSGFENADVQSGSFAEGVSGGAPYSLIWIEGQVEELPETLIAQLADGGRLICGTADGPVARLSMGIKRGGELAMRSFADGEITPISGFARTKSFAF